MVLVRKVTENIIVDEGEHNGVITDVREHLAEKNNEKFTYIDFYVTLAGTDRVLKFGVPDNVSEKSKAGKLLTKFGHKLRLGETIDFETLKNENIIFTTVNNTSKDNITYPSIVLETVRPLIKKNEGVKKV